MSDFDSQIKAAAEKAVLKFIGDGGWLLPNYESRLKIPSEWLGECWKLVDANKIKEQIAKRVEEELADRVVNRMAEELSTDIKQVLSVKERREALRSLVRDNLDSLTKL